MLVLAPHAAAAAERCPLCPLDWLIGDWAGARGGQRIEERWYRLHPRVLVGQGRTIEGGRVVWREHLLIQAGAGGRVVYSAWPQGQALAHFALQSPAQRAAAVFANPQHDYPQRISYRRRGPRLEAQISGRQAGVPRTASWHFDRAPAAAPPSAAAGAALVKTVELAAPPAAVWRAWTTAAGVATFFAPEAHIALAPGGAYELLFDRDQPAGKQGSEGCTVVELTPGRRLVVTWNFPPSLPAIRDAHTLVTIELTPQAAGRRTRLTLTHSGWQAGADWQRGRRYFDRAWDGVLGRLRQLLPTPTPAAR